MEAVIESNGHFFRKVRIVKIPLIYNGRGLLLDEFKEELEKMDQKLSTQVLYVFADPNNGVHRPWYVGRGATQTDGRPPFARIKKSAEERIHNIIIKATRRPQYLYIYILDVSFFSTREKKALLASAETTLIKQARLVNPDLLNKTQFSSNVKTHTEFNLSLIGVNKGPFRWINKNKGRKKDAIRDGIKFARMLGWN